MFYFYILVFDLCFGNFCMNGICEFLESGYVCICYIGYLGMKCDKG